MNVQAAVADDGVEDFGNVVVSFTVFVSDSVDALTEYLNPGDRHPDGFFYDLGTEAFIEPDWQARPTGSTR